MCTCQPLTCSSLTNSSVTMQLRPFPFKSITFACHAVKLAKTADDNFEAKSLQALLADCPDKAKVASEKAILKQQAIEAWDVCEAAVKHAEAKLEDWTLAKIENEGVKAQLAKIETERVEEQTQIATNETALPHVKKSILKAQPKHHAKHRNVINARGDDRSCSIVRNIAMKRCSMSVCRARTMLARHLRAARNGRIR